MVKALVWWSACLVLSCASSHRAPGIDTTCDPDAGPCVKPGGPGSGDASSDTAGADTFDGGVSIDVSGTARALAAFAHDPHDPALPVPASRTVRANGSGGGLVSGVTGAGDGSFALAGLARTDLGWIQVGTVSGATFRAEVIVGVPLTAPVTGLVLPVYAPDTAATLSTLRPVVDQPRLVIQVFDASAPTTPKAGVTALPSVTDSALVDGPFYDDGKDGMLKPPVVTSTGKQGTIVFIVEPGTLDFSVRLGTGSSLTSPIRPLLANGAVTYLRASL